MKLFEARCKHRHTRAEHPQCFEPELKEKGVLPKILIFDIETSPLEVYIWNLKTDYVSPEKIKQDYFMLSWSAKWFMDRHTMSDVLTQDEALSKNDNRITKSLWELVDMADIVIAHNGKKFDIKKLNTRFILNGLNPPRPYEIIDTLQVARSIFGFSSNTLNYLNLLLGLNLKLENGGFELWKSCLAGDRDALRLMEKYNKRDVTILEELYIALRPWIKSHPNLGLYMQLDKPVCRNCGSPKLTVTGYSRTLVGKYELVRCACGAIGRLPTNLLAKEDKKIIVR